MPLRLISWVVGGLGCSIEGFLGVGGARGSRSGAGCVYLFFFSFRGGGLGGLAELDSGLDILIRAS